MQFSFLGFYFSGVSNVKSKYFFFLILEIGNFFFIFNFEPPWSKSFRTS